MSSELEPNTETKGETGTSTKVTDQPANNNKPVSKEVRFRPIKEEENGLNDAGAWQQSARPKSQSPTPKASPTLHFYSGNPSVEKVKGILHIYKDKYVHYCILYNNEILHDFLGHKMLTSQSGDFLIPFFHDFFVVSVHIFMKA